METKKEREKKRVKIKFFFSSLSSIQSNVNFLPPFFILNNLENSRFTQRCICEKKTFFLLSFSLWFCVSNFRERERKVSREPILFHSLAQDRWALERTGRKVMQKIVVAVAVVEKLQPNLGHTKRQTQERSRK